MTVLVLTQAARTIWDEQDRIENTAGSPLSEPGIARVEALAAELAGQEIAAVYSSAGEGELQTARMLGDILDVKVRQDEGLRELDYGLLQGLTGEQFRKRHPKLHKLWSQSPEGFRAPNGETLDELRQRLQRALREIARRHKAEAACVVLRPVALAMSLCILKDVDSSHVAEHMEPEFTWSRYETTLDRLKDED